MAKLSYARNLPYNGLPKLPPQSQIETLRTLKKAISANKALAELRSAGDLIPNQTILIRAIILQEAKVSSEIENVITTNDELYRAFGAVNETTNSSTKEVLRYQEAVWYGKSQLEKGARLDTALFTEIARIIKREDLNVRSRPGTQIIAHGTREPVYTPPEGEAVLISLLENLTDFAYADDGFDPLIKMAVLHYQFEAIHPFPDGNGRTGRVLNILYLVAKDLLEIPALYLSRYIIQNRREYYRALRDVTERGSWEDWIVYMLEAIELTSVDTRHRILAIRSAMEGALHMARREMKRGYSKELIELVFQQPYTRISLLEQAGIAKRDAASEYLRELERIGLLVSAKYGRERLFYNARLLELLSG